MWMSESIFDRAIVRVAALPSTLAAALRDERLSLVAAEVDQAERAMTQAFEVLAERCFQSITGQDDMAVRRQLLSIKRDAHGGRVQRLRQHLDRASGLPSSVLISLANAVQAGELLSVHTAAYQDAYSAALERAGHHLATLALRDDIVDVVASATEGFEGPLRRLGQRLLDGKRRRSTEDTLALYLARAGLKTSPLGRLAVVGIAHLGDITPQAAQWCADAIVHRWALNLGWISAAFETLTEHGEMPLQLVPHVTRGKDVIALVRDERLREDMPRLQGTHERVVVLRGLSEVITDERWRDHANLDGLLRTRGLLMPQPPVAMQAWGDLDRVANGLEAQGPCSKVIAHALRMVSTESALAPALPLDARRQLQGKIAATLQETTGCNASRMPRPVIFEDTLAPGCAALLSKSQLMDGLSDLQRLVSVMTTCSPRYAQERTLAEALYNGFGERPTPLLEAAGALVREDLLERSNPLELDDIDAFLSAQGDFRNALRTLVQPDEEGNLHLDAKDLERLWSSLWPYPSGRRLASAMVQLVAQPAGMDLVLNGLFAGGGKLFSRFLAGADLDGACARRIAAYIESQTQLCVTELCGVQGFNANLHPLMTSRVCDYPGLPSAVSDWPCLRFEDLYLRAAGHPRLPVVTEGPDGSPLGLVDLAFLSETLMPPVRRLLQRLTVQAAPDLSPLTVRWRPQGHDGIHRRPRLSVGRVVVWRRAHRLPASLLLSATDDATFFRTYSRIVSDYGVADPGFARALVATRAETEGTSSSRPVERKPMWVDRHTPHYVRLLRQMVQPGVKAISVEEALPNPMTDGLPISGRAHAAEWIFEIAVGELNPISNKEGATDV